MQFHLRTLLIVTAVVLTQVIATGVAMHFAQPALVAASEYVMEGMHRAIVKGCCGFTLS